MVYIVKQKVSGKDYYYLRKSQRIGGKVKSLYVAYLGKTRKEAKKNMKKVLKNLKDDEMKEKNKMETGNLDKEKMSEQEFSGKESKEFLSFIREAGFIWGPEPEIYGGLAGFYTYGRLGKL